MVQLILGVKGTGKTKMLIDMVNGAIDKTDGAVVCVEKSGKLIREIKYQVRLINTDEYMIGDAHALYGFISGICASNHDVTDIFIDSALKICNYVIADFTALVKDLEKFAEKHGINVIITSSIADEDTPGELRSYMIAH